MVKLQLLVTALMGAVATAVSTANITYSQHFLTEELNKAAPYYDLSPFGYLGGQLPKVYGLSPNQTTNHTSSGLAYLPEESYKEFHRIIHGLNNATAESIAQQKAAHSVGRRTTNHITMTLRSKSGGGDSFSITADHTVCHKGSNTPWHYIVVTYIQDAYITLWESAACNGDKGSFNPVCDWYDSPGETCVLNFSPKSFRAYSGCHNSYGMGKGCSHTSL